MGYGFPKVKQDSATPVELQEVLKLRLGTLDHVATLVAPGGPPDAADRTGWRGTVKILGRDRDGCLLARITVTAPELSRPYVRRVRLVKRKHLRLVIG